MIISGGFNIYPSEIEQVLWSHPAVQDCAVIGAPDEKWGEAVTAIVEVKAGACTSTPEAICGVLPRAPGRHEDAEDASRSGTACRAAPSARC